MCGKLWFNRIQQHLLTWIKYAKYIFSGHILIVLIFLTGFLAVKYEQWVSWLVNNTPIVILACLLLSIITVFGSVQTFLKKPDTVFLLPLEKKMYKYFLNSFFYSFFVQAVSAFIIVYLLAAIVQYEEKHIKSISVLIICTLLLKFLSLLLNFLNNFIFSVLQKNMYRVILLVINFIILIKVVAEPKYIYLLLMHVLLLCLTLAIARKQVIPWQQLVENDQKLTLKFFRLVNMFIDIPLLNHRLHERRYIPINKKYISGRKAISYLAYRTFVRMDDYAGIFLRITILAVLFLLYIKTFIVQLIVVFVCLYATGIQLLSIKQRYNFSLWINIYPFSKEETFKEVCVVVRNILFTQLLFLCIVVSFNSIWNSLLYLVCGVIITLFITRARKDNRKYK